MRRLTVELLELSYRVDSHDDRIVLPHGNGVRRDGLWKTTCFELFVGSAGSPAYRELNFSPGGDWAAYEFSGYRQGQRDALLQAAPLINLVQNKQFIDVVVSVLIEGLDDDDPISISAVIDERAAGLSYWSCQHTSDRPDFHHPSCFTLTLPPPEQP